MERCLKGSLNGALQAYKKDVVNTIYNACQNSWNTLPSSSIFPSLPPLPQYNIELLRGLTNHLQFFQNILQQYPTFKKNIVLGERGLFTVPKSCLIQRSYEEETLLLSMLVYVAFQILLAMVVARKFTHPPVFQVDGQRTRDIRHRRSLISD